MDAYTGSNRLLRESDRRGRRILLFGLWQICKYSIRRQYSHLLGTHMILELLCCYTCESDWPALPAGSLPDFSSERNVMKQFLARCLHFLIPEEYRGNEGTQRGLTTAESVYDIQR